MTRALIAGASGFVGRALVTELLERGVTVRCLVRDTQSASSLELGRAGCELRRGDVIRPETLAGVADGVDIAYYLVHLMASDGGALAARERGAAGAFARECRRGGVARMIYLGGLGDAGASEHLGSRHGTAGTLRSEGPPLTYFRAGLVVGAGSESYALLRALVDLPGETILAPEWIHNRTQPIGIDTVVRYLVRAGLDDEVRDREIQLGGPEVMTYAELVDRMAEALGEPRMRRVAVRGLSVGAAGRGAGAITPGDPRVAAHITAGLATDTVVTDPSGAESFEIKPESLAIALAKAIEAEAQAEEDGG